MNQIKTKRLTLTPYTVGLEKLFAISRMVDWLNDPEVMRYSEHRHKRHSIQSQHVYVQSFDPNYYRYIVAGNELIGSISARIDDPNNVADIGILIGDRNQWGMGYGSEAWNAFCDFLSSRGLRKIEAGCMAHNRGMTNICFRYGMKEEGRRVSHFMVGGKLSDMLLFGKLV